MHGERCYDGYSNMGNHEVEESSGLWIAADSLVSAMPGSPLIEDAAKLFGLPIVCRSPDKEGFFSQIYYAHTYGYCFAGSTLMGQNAYLALAPLLSNLVSSTSYVPSLADVSQHVLSYLRLTFDDYKERVGPQALFEVALFGHCISTNKLSVFHYTPKLTDGVYMMSCVSYEDIKDRDFIYLGDERAYMSAKIAAAFSGESVPGRPLSRIPRHVIQDHIDAQDFPNIGGDLQLGIADRLGFRPFALCKPRVIGQPAAYLSYLGRELTPISRMSVKLWLVDPLLCECVKRRSLQLPDRSFYPLFIDHLSRSGTPPHLVLLVASRNPDRWCGGFLPVSARSHRAWL